MDLMVKNLFVHHLLLLLFINIAEALRTSEQIKVVSSHKHVNSGYCIIFKACETSIYCYKKTTDLLQLMIIEKMTSIVLGVFEETK